MSVPSGAEPAGPLDHSSAPETRLQGRLLVLAWTAGVADVVFYLGLFVVSLPGYLAQLQTPCLATGLAADATNSPCMSGQLSPAAAATLQHLGLSLAAYATLTLAAYLLVNLLSCALAGLLVLRRPHDWMALLVALMLVSIGSNLINPFSLSHAVGPALAVRLASLSDQVSITPTALAFYLFPNGRFVPRWTRWMVVMGLLVSLLLVFFPRFSNAWANVISGPAYVGLIVSLVIAQVYRYRRVSTQLQRQQTKWLVSSLAVIILLLFIGPHLLEVPFPSLGQAGSLFASLSTTCFNLLLVLIPVSIGAAILRYRLWDIDALINKTLVYGSLTGLLGVVYVGLIIGFTSLAGLFGGTAAQNPVVLVISTLAIAALVLPLRRRIQAIIDRRFYRRKYDAEKTLAAFSATLRNEVELQQVRERLLAVVTETMQPAHVSLWLRAPERHPTEQAHRLEPRGPSAGKDDEPKASAPSFSSDGLRLPPSGECHDVEYLGCCR